MRLASLRRILLIQAIEKADTLGECLPEATRSDATREAARPLSRESGEREQDRFFSHRAELLSDHLIARRPALAPLVPPPHRLRYLVPALLLLAVIIGWSTQALGAEKLVNILSFPLLGILGWNLAVYLFELLLPLIRRAAPGNDEDTSPAGPLTRLAEFAETLPPGPRPRPTESDFPASLRQALTDFQRRWRRLAEPLTHRRIRAALHLAAALLAAAAVAGMYAKGAANEYRAYWESTFFTPAALQVLLGTVLGPAATLSGLEIPDVAPLHRTASHPQVVGENAARWIHLYALTIGLFVILPRLILGTWHTLAARTRESTIDPRDLPGTGLYYHRLLAEALGTALTTAAVAYCHRPTPTGEASLQRTLETRLGVPIKLDWQPPIALGEEETAPAQILPPPDTTPPAHFALCLDFAATPEQETHGELIRTLRKALTEAAPETRLHLALDAEGFDDSRRHLPDFPDRRTARLEAWRAVAGPLREELTVFPE